MAQTPTHFHVAARKVKPLAGYPVNSMGDVAALAKLGITMRPGVMDAMYKAHQGGMSMLSGAMDSNLVAPQSTPSIGTPIQFLQSWLPGFVQTVTQARQIDTLVGVSTVGRWEDEEIVQGFSERAGNALPYQDNTNVPLTGWNTNFERRSIVRFEQGFMVGRLEEARAAAMNYNSAENKRMQATLSLDVQRNYIGFYGYNSGAGRTYGYLNDPSLPAYVNLPNGASGFSTWATKTTLEIIADILTSLQALRTQSGNLIDPKKTPITMGVAMSAVDYLSTVTTLGFSVQNWLNTNYPNVRIESAPELNAANGGANVFYLHADEFGEYSSDDGRVFIQMVPAKFITLGAQQLTKGYEEDFGNATAGIMCKRPWSVIRRSGC
jgi:hypothetical protein